VIPFLLKSSDQANPLNQSDFSELKPYYGIQFNPKNATSRTAVPSIPKNRKNRSTIRGFVLCPKIQDEEKRFHWTRSGNRPS